MGQVTVGAAKSEQTNVPRLAPTAASPDVAKGEICNVTAKTSIGQAAKRSATQTFPMPPMAHLGSVIRLLRKQLQNRMRQRRPQHQPRRRPPLSFLITLARSARLFAVFRRRPCK